MFYHPMHSMTTQARPTKGSPVPTRYHTPEDEFLKETARQTGLTVAEVVRRSVRLARQHTAIVKSRAFFLDLAL